MPKGYWIARVDVHDPEVYKMYVSGAAPAFAEFGGRFLARGGTHVAIEGTARARNVIIEFPSFKAAQDCFHSAAYQAAREHRLPVADAEIVLVEGFEA